MANILTASEAASVLRCATTDPAMLAILPGIDAYLQRATGRDWAHDDPIFEEAKSAARMLLVLWYENPGMIAQGMTNLSFGLRSTLLQLEAIACQYFNIEGISSSGYIELAGAKKGDTVSSVTGLIGSSGDQSASFESVISEDGYIQQLSSSDLSGKWFRVHLVPVEDL